MGVNGRWSLQPFALAPRQRGEGPPLHRGALLLATAAACWPVWLWYAARLGDSGDDAMGVAALLALLGLALLVARHRMLGTRRAI